MATRYSKVSISGCKNFRAGNEHASSAESTIGPPSAEGMDGKVSNHAALLQPLIADYEYINANIEEYGRMLERSVFVLCLLFRYSKFDGHSQNN